MQGTEPDDRTRLAKLVQVPLLVKSYEGVQLLEKLLQRLTQVGLRRQKLLLLGLRSPHLASNFAQGLMSQ